MKIIFSLVTLSEYKDDLINIFSLSSCTTVDIDDDYYKLSHVWHLLESGPEDGVVNTITDLLQIFQVDQEAQLAQRLLVW